MKGVNELQQSITMGENGEDFGNWMSTPVFYVLGGIVLAFIALAGLSFMLLQFIPLGIFCLAVSFVVFLFGAYAFWVRTQYSYTGGRKMDQVHQVILSNIDFAGKGKILEVGCGSGALCIRAAYTWPDAEIYGVDYWSAVYNYNQKTCQSNAVKAGVEDQCIFVQGDAQKLDYPDESFDMVLSNYVYHNITGANKQDLLLETLRVLKKGGVFALNDSMKPRMYGDLDKFAQKLRDMGFEQVEIMDTGSAVFGSQSRAKLMFLEDSKMLIGRK